MCLCAMSLESTVETLKCCYRFLLRTQSQSVTQGPFWIVTTKQWKKGHQPFFLTFFLDIICPTRGLNWGLQSKCLVHTQSLVGQIMLLGHFCLKKSGTGETAFPPLMLQFHSKLVPCDASGLSSHGKFTAVV